MNEGSTKTKYLQEPCIICNTIQDDMLHLLEKPICACCEQVIIDTDCDQPEMYLFHVSRLKKIWLNESDIREEGTF
ncbi:Inhibitor of sigma-G Gin [Thermoactinomyces sp. DSM 45891]|uniref:sigma factor G inhibitor Gin n=1 Tax=Thermoactinomyces sp. DSM 45891 TaxID=1761907 RepID=UPI0009163A86|nr:sigma factor G inhibitor Gin [Thermoactinomyces sp. DSM 45891]SFX40471.1 Inhibitor of sigma-G Gin [Thermoactinomyces sp. DSM 45891]